MVNHLPYKCISTLFLSLFALSATISQTNPTATLKDSPTTIMGINHIGISVKDLPATVAFYQRATDFEIIKREKVSDHKDADVLYGHEGLAYERVTFKAPNMLLELTAFSNQKNTVPKKMLPQGPGMTHTCYQSPAWESGYQKFRIAKIEMLSRGNTPVDLGGYGVTYAYGYDPEGNMLELEQLSKDYLKQTQMDSLWVNQHNMWMTQVAIISPDLKKISDFYRKVLDFAPNRIAHISGNPRLDDIVDQDSLVINASWYKMDGYGKMLELMQYENPKTSGEVYKRDPTALGYTFSIEVENIQQEYERLSQLGVAFLSAPQILGEFWTVFAHDIDGNVFALRQAVSKASIYSLKNFQY